MIAYTHKRHAPEVCRAEHAHLSMGLLMCFLSVGGDAVGHDYEPVDSPWSLLFLDLLAVSAGAGMILLVLRWLGLAIPFLHQLGFA